MRTTILTTLLICCIQLQAHEHKKSLEFIENKAQWNENILYRCAVPTGTIFLENACITYTFVDPQHKAQLHDLQQASQEEQDAFRMNGHAWKMQLIGAQSSQVTADQESKHYYNFFTGNDPSKWSDHVRGYESVRYESLYQGIDMQLYSHESNFKYDFIVAPGADADQIQLDYEGLDDLKVLEGNLVLETSIGNFMESRPYAYQLIDGKQVQVACEYALEGSIVTFSFPEGYDHDLELIIDPELIAATLSGTTANGWEDNYGHCATFDIEGNIFTGCVAGGNGYPTTTGSFEESYGGGIWDIGISKLTPDGTDLLWATFLGGQDGDYPHSMICNDNQELYVYGSTSSSNYPVSASAFQSSFGGGNSDIIVSHLSSDGASLIGSTYLGGSDGDGRNTNSFNYGDTYRGEIILDFDNDPVIASCSSSSNFPMLAESYQTVIGGNQDAVLVKLNPSLSALSVSTFIGGDENDTGYGVRTSVDGSFYVGGGAGEGFPTTAGAYETSFQGPTGGWNNTDGFIAKLNSNGSSLLKSTYFGTEESDQIFFIDLDFDENVFVFGQGGGDIPVLGSVYVNDQAPQFVSKFNSDLDELLISTTIGEGDFGGNFVPDAFLVDNCDNIYISAYSASSGMETTDDALFDIGGFYLAVFESDMEEMIFGTYYTGNHVDGGTSRFDKNGIVYQAVCSGGGFSTTPDAWATDQDTGWDIGVFKINFDASGVNAAVAANDVSGCAPYEITFENYSVGDQFLWDFGDGSTSTEYEPTYIYTDPGVYTVSLIASDSLSCNLADTSSFDITISTPQDYTPSFEFEVECASQQVICTNTTDLDFLQYIWDMGDGTLVEDYDVTYQYDDPGDYTVSLLAIDNGCDSDEEITADITIEPSVDAVIGSEGLEACDELEAIFSNTSTNAESFIWDFGDGTTSTFFEPEHTFIGPATFEVILTATNLSTCNQTDQDTVIVTIGATQTLELDFDIIQTDCVNFDVESNNQSVGNNCGYSWNMGDGTILNGYDITYSYAGIGTYNVTLTMTDTICNITEQETVPVDVNDEVVAIITNGDEIGCMPFTVDFVSGSPGVVTWDFGDGSPTQVGDEVSHLFDEPGIYTITMNVVGDSGCTGTDEVTSTVEVIEPPVIIPAFEFLPVGECEDMEFEFTNLSEGAADVFYWQFGDGSTSDEESPTYSFDQQGVYEVLLTVWNSVCEIEEEYSLVVSPDPVLEYELSDTRICPEIGTVVLDAEIPGAVYDWSTGDETQTIEVSTPGTYEVLVNLIGCWFSDEIDVEFIETLELSRIVTQCRTESNTLVIPFDNAQSYLWDNGVEEQFMDVEESGLYGFTLIDSFGCEHSGTIDATIEPNEANVYIPNSFTPNDDGINDYFKPVAADLDEYKLQIYNRWGQLIFETEDLDRHWNGGVQDGEPYYVPDGTYTYTITYRSICSTERITKKGSITVFR